MNDKMRQNSIDLTNKRKAVKSVGRDLACLGVFVALVIASQLCFSAIPGVEIVTLLFVTYSFVFGWKRGMIAATTFSLLRQVVFGIYPVVLILYLLYYNFLTLVFGGLGSWIKRPAKYLILIVFIACICTVCFTLMDNVLTTLWYGYSARATELYFKASLSFMLPQVVCTAISVFCLFLPLHAVFVRIRKK